METLAQEKLSELATLVADRTLSESERERRAFVIAGSRELMRRALDWLPEAFGLAAIASMDGMDGMDGIKMPTTFSAKSMDGTWFEFPFSAEPLFAQSVVLALHSPDIFKQIAEQSSCINALDNALNAGCDLTGLVLSGPALLGVPAEAYSDASLGVSTIEADFRDGVGAHSNAGSFAQVHSANFSDVPSPINKSD